MKPIATTKFGTKIYSIKPFGGFVEIVFKTVPNYHKHSKLLPIKAEEIEKVFAMTPEEIANNYIHNNKIQTAAG